MQTYVDIAHIRGGAMTDPGFAFTHITKEHIQPLAQLCLAELRRQGMGRALKVLLEITRQFSPVSRINGVFISRDGNSILNIFDTQPNDRMVSYYLSPEQTASIAAKQTLWKKKIAVRLEDINKPTLINDLSSYKEHALLNNSLYNGIPFLRHNALLRLPVFTMEPFVFVFNFWSDMVGAFTPEHMPLMQELIGPLGKELEANFALSDPEQYREQEEMELSEKSEPFLDFYVRQLEHCPGLRDVCGLIRKVARTDATVIIQGETGTGKEFVACAVHEQSPRREKPFVVVNCGAIPSTLIESELFGHERGAFTGAVSTHKGYFEQAQGGTIFLDEIGDLPLSAQVKLLRVLEKGHFVRVGGDRAMSLDVRIIAATNVDLDAKMRKGLFRRDLWYRLAVFPMSIPPLRERRDDIPHLVKEFLLSKAQSLKLNFRGSVSEKEIRRLYDYDWPGNVRELEHVVERSLIIHDNDKGILHFVLPGESMGEMISFPLSSAAERNDKTNEFVLNPSQGGHWPTLKEVEERHIRETLKKTKGKMLGVDGASTLLGIHYSTLRAKMQNMGLPLPREAQRKNFSS